MGIFDAMNTSVGGLQAQSYALQNISGNIANSSTTGYKGIGTSFVDLIPDASVPSKQVAGGVTANAKATITTQGTISSSSVATNMAITGDGFFSIQKATGVVDNVPVFSGVTYYTRRGDFQLNANGNLVNGAGYYLMGVTVDPKTGNPLGSVPTVLQFQNNFIPAQATTSIQYAANLPTQPNTAASSTAASGTLLAAGGLNPSDFASNPLPVGSPAPPRTPPSRRGPAANMCRVRSPLRRNCRAPRRATRCLRALQPVTPLSSVLPPRRQSRLLRRDGLHDATHIPADGTVGDLLTAIGTATGGAASTIDATTGAITFHTGTAQDLTITSTAPAFSALGLTQPGDPGTWRWRHRRNRYGDRQRHRHLHQGIDQRRRGDGLQRRRHAGEPATALGQDRQCLAGRRSFRHLEPVLPDRPERDRHAGRPGSTPDRPSPSPPTARSTSPSGSGITINNVTVSGQSARLGRLQHLLGRADAICRAPAAR